jgi:hypothetical protein
MPKWIMEDDCLAPARTIRINFTGPNPFRVYPPIRRMLGTLLEIRGKNIWERDFRWDFSSDPRDFFVRIVAQKSCDAWTKAYIELIFQGKQPTDPTKDGDLVIQITPKLITAMPEDTVWQRTPIYKFLRWFYLRYFYNDARRTLLDYCVSWTNKLNSELQKLLGIGSA